MKVDVDDIICGSDDFRPVEGKHLLELLARALPPRRRYDSTVNLERNEGMTYYDDFSRYDTAVWYLAGAPRSKNETIGDWEALVASRKYTIPEIKKIIRDVLEEPKSKTLLVPELPEVAAK